MLIIKVYFIRLSTFFTEPSGKLINRLQVILILSFTFDLFEFISYIDKLQLYLIENLELFIIK